VLKALAELPFGVIYDAVLEQRKLEQRRDLEAANGFVLLCGNWTERECLERRLFGAPYDEWNRISQIKKGDVLFLLNYQTNRLHGIYEAVGDAELNIEPYAFGGRFPAQVRVRTKLHCSPAGTGALLPLIKRRWIRVSHNGRLLFPKKLNYKFVDELYRIFLRIPRLPTVSVSPAYDAKDGHPTSSFGEKTVDNWLHEHLTMAHDYAKPVRRENREIVSDWYIPDIDLYVEYWDTPSGEETNEMHLKHLFYKRNSIRFIDLFINELPDADRIIAKKISSIEPSFRFKRLLGKLGSDNRSHKAKIRKNMPRKKR
jgi:hypothetical protein